MREDQEAPAGSCHDHWPDRTWLVESLGGGKPGLLSSPDTPGARRTFVDDLALPVSARWRRTASPRDPRVAGLHRKLAADAKAWVPD